MKSFILMLVAAVLLMGCGNENEVLSFNERQFTKSAYVSVTAKHKELNTGYMIVKAKVFPYKGEIEETLKKQDGTGMYNSLILTFKDADDFTIKSYKIELRKMVKYPESLQLNFALLLSRENFNQISDMTTTYEVVGAEKSEGK